MLRVTDHAPGSVLTLELTVAAPTRPRTSPERNYPRRGLTARRGSNTEPPGRAVGRFLPGGGKLLKLLLQGLDSGQLDLRVLALLSLGLALEQFLIDSLGLGEVVGIAIGPACGHHRIVLQR